MDQSIQMAIYYTIHQILTPTVLPTPLSNPVAPQSKSMYWGLLAGLDDLDDYSHGRCLYTRCVPLESNNPGWLLSGLFLNHRLFHDHRGYQYGNRDRCTMLTTPCGVEFEYEQK